MGRFFYIFEEKKIEPQKYLKFLPKIVFQQIAKITTRSVLRVEGITLNKLHIDKSKLFIGDTTKSK